MQPEKIFILILTVFAYSVCCDYRDIKLSQGVVRGYNVDSDEVVSFYGIPYATVPVGEDRFKAPLPPRSWDGILNATGYNIVCYQGKEFDPAILDAVKTYDCLIVNIFIPKVANETNLPVLYLIHGGAMQFGNGNQWYPGGLVSKGMIVVTFNYRLGVHGFLCLNTEYAPGNAGMKDKIAALKWLKENIAKFGGDPDNISVAGTSSGSTAAGFVVLSPMSDGLIKRVMFEGGSELTNILIKEPINLAERFANQFGVYTNENVTLLESFYRSLKDDQLNTFLVSDFKHLGFLPCVETHKLEGVEKFFSETPIDIINSGNYKKIPIMSGFTPFDGMDYFLRFFNYEKEMKVGINLTEFIPTDVEIKSEEHALELTERIKNMYFPTGEFTRLGFVNYFTDSVFIYPQYASARLHTRNAVPVHLYIFLYNGTINLPIMRSNLTPIWGPGHVAQSLYLYDYEDRSIYNNITDEELGIRDRIREIYYSFCKYGIPVPRSFHIEWPVVNVDIVHTLHMDNEFYMGECPFRERLEFWDQIYKYNYTTEPGSACNFSLSLIVGVFSIIVFFSLLF